MQVLNGPSTIWPRLVSSSSISSIKCRFSSSNSRHYHLQVHRTYVGTGRLLGLSQIHTLSTSRYRRALRTAQHLVGSDTTGYDPTRKAYKRRHQPLLQGPHKEDYQDSIRVRCRYKLLRRQERSCQRKLRYSNRTAHNTKRRKIRLLPYTSIIGYLPTLKRSRPHPLARVNRARHTLKVLARTSDPSKHIHLSDVRPLRHMLVCRLRRRIHLPRCRSSRRQADGEHSLFSAQSLRSKAVTKRTARVEAGQSADIASRARQKPIAGARGMGPLNLKQRNLAVNRQGRIESGWVAERQSTRVRCIPEAELYGSLFSSHVLIFWIWPLLFQTKLFT